MTAINRLFRTTAFRLSAIYFVVFSVFAVAFVLWISRETDRLLTGQVYNSIESEIGILADEASNKGLTGLVAAIEQRTRLPGSSLYVLVDNAGRVVAGNVSDVPPELTNRKLLDPVTVPYKRDAASPADNTAMVVVLPVPNGFKLLVGRDISEVERIRVLIAKAMVLALTLLIVLALASWFLVSRRVLKRIDSVTAMSRQFMSGDLSGRLAMTGTGDEFDRLAENVNAMLDRIEHLLWGFKDVSDNIAHDLKTPLTRLRTRVETALAGPERTADYRAALEGTIEEADQLIRTFNALLMIARVDAGSAEGGMAPLDVAELVAGIAELYEPVAEAAEVFLEVKLDAPLPMLGSRELINQAVANLIDNAIKYVRSGDASPSPAHVGVEARRDGREIVVRVSDNGPGIPETERIHVLQRFVRLEKSRSQPGTGLGLSLVDAVVRLHHGTMSLGDAGPGLVVTLRFPASG